MKVLFIIPAKAISIVCLTTLTACSFAPDYKRPDTEPVAAFKEDQGWVQARPADDQPKGAWWTVFNDNDLNALEDKVTSANQNLKVAVAQFQQARAVASVAHADYFPALNGNVNPTRQKASSNIANVRPVSVYNDYLGSLDFSYEIDVWGRVRNSVAAAENRAEASAADLATIDLALHAELASDYFMLRGDDASQKVLDETVGAYQKALELTQRRHEGGAAAEADVDQAETQLENAKTQAEDMRLKRAQLEHAIAVLTGQMPSNFSLPQTPFKADPPALAIGLPSTLLERRPDIAAAERRTAAANADIGVARAAFFPSFSLGGLLGLESAKASNWLTAPSRFWSLGPSMAVSLIDGGRISALTDEARAAYDEAAANYRQTVLTGYQEVEDNMAALRQLERESKSQKAATHAAERSLAQAKNRYVGGVTIYLDVVTAQNLALQAELALIDVATRRMTASVQLVKALGGGWQTDTDGGIPLPEIPIKE